MQWYSFTDGFRSVATGRLRTAIWFAVVAAIWFTVHLPISPAHAQGSADSTDLVELSLEDLMNVEVVSVSKKEEKLTDAAAAVFVITGEDLRQSGATSIPDALRTVPGMQVASIDANSWAVTSRGFNSNFANKLLVLIDGRSVYTPMFSGVWWDAQDVMLGDVDRIEIIRGPGATLWGANAVNGVINIITKNASETRGGEASVRVGNYENGNAELRVGTKAGEKGALRVYGKAFERNSFVDGVGQRTADNWTMLRAGWRYDAALGDKDSIRISGEGYDGDVGVTYALPVLNAPYIQLSETRISTRGAHGLGRWSRALSPTSSVSLQMFYDYSRRSDVVVRSQLSTLDVEAQHRFALSQAMGFMWGVGYRAVSHRYFNNFFVAMNPDQRTLNMASGFAQIDAQIVPGRLRLTLGTKVEYNDYTDVEVQPNVRLLWKPAPNHTVWSAVSRAVRLPSRGERDGQIAAMVLPPLSLSATIPIPIKIEYVGSESSVSEGLVAYELGYRVQPVASLALDVATFYNRYDHLIGGVAGTPAVDPLDPTYAVLPVQITNDRAVDAAGAELAADWLAHRSLRFRASYTYIDFVNDDDVSASAFSATGLDVFEVSGPRHQASLFTVLDMTRQWQVSTRIRYVDAIRDLAMDSYTALDARLAWRIRPGLTWAITGQDLLQAQHEEYRSELMRVNSQLERRFYTELIWGM